MGLYAQRKRERDFAEREAAGEDVFSRELTKLARGRIANAIKSSLGGDLAGHWDDNTFTDARRLVLAAEGTPGHISQPGSIAELDILATIRGGEHALAASCIEAVLEAARGRYDPIEGHVAPHSKIDAILREERIAMRLVDGRLIDFSSEELHEEVVAPALRLLGGRDGWQAVEDAYRDALEEIGQNPADAITDSGTAYRRRSRSRGPKATRSARWPSRRAIGASSHPTTARSREASPRSSTGCRLTAPPAATPTTRSPPAPATRGSPFTSSAR